MNDKQVRDLIRGQFMNEMLFRIWDNMKSAAGQENKKPVKDEKPPMYDYYIEQHNKKHKHKKN